MALFSSDYFRETKIASAFGTVFSLFGITWIIVFLSYFASDPRTVELLSLKSIAAGGGAAVILGINGATGFLITSLVVHFLWLQASAVLHLGNKWRIVGVLRVWIILSFVVIFTDLLGAAFSISSLFTALSEKKIRVEVIVLYAKLFTFFSKLGFPFHILLVYFIYATKQRKKQIRSFGNKATGKRAIAGLKAGLFTTKKSSPRVSPISTIRYHLERYNEVPCEQTCGDSTNNHLRLERQYAFPFDTYSESLYSGYYTLPATDFAPADPKDHPSTSAVSTSERLQQSASGEEQVTEL